MTEDKPKYDHYNQVLFNDDPLSADLSRKPSCCAPKIGTEPRMQENMSSNITPGPQYLVKQKPDSKKAPDYTFGFRRSSGAGLEAIVSTPGAVGPGRYVPESAVNPSTK